MKTNAHSITPVAPIPVAVIGFGRMGRRHAETLLRLPEFSVAAVIDTDPAQAAAANALGLHFSTRLADVSGSVRAAVIAAPTEDHAHIFEQLSQRGIDCLIEKPIGVSLAQLDRMSASASARGTRIFAGYCERFHPAVQALHASLGQLPRRIDIHRTSPEALHRCFDIDVMLDLLVHDLDWLYSLIDEEPIEAILESASAPSHQLEEVICRLRFGNSLQVRLTASRIAATRQRTVTVTHNSGELQDFSFDAAPAIASDDNLTAQAKAFAAALRGEPSRIAGIDDARRVMSLVQRLQDSLPADDRLITLSAAHGG